MRASLLGSLAVGIGIAALAMPARAEDHIAWASSFDAALAQAKATHKLVMADFYTDW